MSLEPEEALKNGKRKHCKATTKAGDPCQAPAVEGGLCFLPCSSRAIGGTGSAGRTEESPVEQSRQRPAT
jgi:hypothetical protein